MPVNEIAKAYLRAFRNNEVIEGGLPYRQALEASDLDGSLASLDRIDDLLDQLHAQLKPLPDVFLSEQAHINFLYLLAFYVGQVVASENGGEPNWLQYQEAVSSIPNGEKMFPQCFAYSLACQFKGGGRSGTTYWPLVAIEERAFSPSPQRSVAYSAKGFL